MDESIFSSPIWRSPRKNSKALNGGRANRSALNNYQSQSKMSMTDESAQIAKLKDRIKALEARVTVTDDLEM